jgi:PAS domain S-box-containing protein
MSFDGQKLKNIRKRMRITAKQLADELGIHRTTVARYEIGSLIPNNKKTIAIANVLGVNPNDFSDVKITTSTEYSDLWYKYSKQNKTAQQLEKDNWHHIIDSYYKNMNSLTQTVQGILYSMPSMFYIKDSNLNYIIINEAYSKLLNKPIDKIVGRNDIELLSRREAKINNERDQEIIKTGRQNTNLKGFIPHTRNRRTGLITKAPLYDSDQEIIGILCSIQDITELEQQTEIARKRGILIDVSEDGFWIGKYIEDGDYLLFDDINKAVGSIFDLSHESIKKDSRLFKSRINSKTQKMLKEWMNETKNTNGKLGVKIYKIFNPDGCNKWIRDSRTRIDQCLYGTILDITKEKVLEIEKEQQAQHALFLKNV